VVWRSQISLVGCGVARAFRPALAIPGFAMLLPFLPVLAEAHSHLDASRTPTLPTLVYNPPHILGCVLTFFCVMEQVVKT